MSAQDPFYLVKEEIQDSVNKVQNSFSKWKQTVPGSVDQIMLSHELVKNCDSVAWQVEELDRAIGVAERDLTRFGLDLVEVDRRRKWTSSTKQQIALIRRAASDIAAPSRDPVKERRELMRLPNGTTGGAGGGGGSSMSAAMAAAADRGDDSISRENEEFLGGAMDRQAMIIKKQDEQLDDLHESVVRLGVVGLTIGGELAEQETLLNELEMDVDSTRGKLDLVQRKVANVLKKAGIRGQMMLLCFLIVLLIILIVLVFNT